MVSLSTTVESSPLARPTTTSRAAMYTCGIWFAMKSGASCTDSWLRRKTVACLLHRRPQAETPTGKQLVSSTRLSPTPSSEPMQTLAGSWPAPINWPRRWWHTGFSIVGLTAAQIQEQSTRPSIGITGRVVQHITGHTPTAQTGWFSRTLYITAAPIIHQKTQGQCQTHRHHHRPTRPRGSPSVARIGNMMPFKTVYITTRPENINM